MKKIILELCLIVGCVTGYAATPAVTSVTARQRYPWNGMVDIDYTITGDASGCKLDVIVEDKQTGKRYVPTKFLSTKSVLEGRHRLTWSTEAEGVTIVSTNVSFTLSLASKTPEAVTNNLYYVIDLSAGPTATSYPVSTLPGVPGGEWSDEYKTTKLVLRRIESGPDPLGRYSITKPFYIGVFEVTVAQWNLIMSSMDIVDKRAKDSVSYNMIRGSSLGANWPGSASVDATSFLGVLRDKTGLNLDLPTEAQWEYACRAGTTSNYNNGGDSESDLQTLGRYSGNGNDGRGGYSGVTTVGSYAPNAWGLYDMHGNVREWCLDWNGTNLVGDDPVGGASGVGRQMRGGLYYDGASRCASSVWGSYGPPWDDYGGYGFRLVCSAGL